MIKRGLAACVEPWHQDIHIFIFHPVQLLLEFPGREPLNDVSSGFPLDGQQDIHAEIFIAVGQVQHLAYLVFAIEGTRLAMHHIVLEDSAVLRREVHDAGILGVEFLGPIGLEADGV